jgi:hypothetical protein
MYFLRVMEWLTLFLFSGILPMFYYYFAQVIAKGTSFVKSNLQGCRFYKAYLVSFQSKSQNGRDTKK